MHISDVNIKFSDDTAPPENIERLVEFIELLAPLSLHWPAANVTDEALTDYARRLSRYTAEEVKAGVDRTVNEHVGYYPNVAEIIKRIEEVKAQKRGQYGTKWMGEFHGYDSPDNCQQCGGMGYYVPDVAPGKAGFGKARRCECFKGGTG